MKKRIPITCDNCGKRFSVKQPKKKIHKDGIEGVLSIFYITCPNCKKKFVSFVENEKLKTMVKENKVLRRKLGTIQDDDEYFEAQDVFEENMTKIKALQKDLKFRFSKYV